MKFQEKKQKKPRDLLLTTSWGLNLNSNIGWGGVWQSNCKCHHSTQKFTRSGETVTHRHRAYVSTFVAVLFPRVDTGSNFNVHQLAMDYYKGILRNRAQQTCSGPESTHFAFVDHLSLYCRFCSFFFLNYIANVICKFKLHLQM